MHHGDRDKDKVLAPTFSLLPTDTRHHAHQIKAREAKIAISAETSQLVNRQFFLELKITLSLLELQHYLLKLLPKQSRRSRVFMAATSAFKCVLPDGSMRPDILFAILGDPVPCFLEKDILVVDPRGVGIEVLAHVGAMILDTSIAKLIVTLADVEIGIKPPSTRSLTLCSMCKVYKHTCRAAYRHPSMRQDSQYICDDILSDGKVENHARQLSCCDFCSGNTIWKETRTRQVNWCAERDVIAQQLLGNQ